MSSKDIEKHKTWQAMLRVRELFSLANTICVFSGAVVISMEVAAE